MAVLTYDDPAVTYDDASFTYGGSGYLFDDIHVTVEMAFGFAPLSTDPDWVPVTDYVRGVDVSRGRNSEFTTYGPGTASLRLDNRDRRFDPEYTAGEYYGDLVPMVPVRITATRAGTVYTVFYGFVTGWPTAYNTANTDAVASVNCVDGTRLLANTILDVADYDDAVVAESPLLYFPMQEREQQTVPLVSPSAYTYTWNFANTSTELEYPVGSSVMLRGNFGFVKDQSDNNWRTLAFWCDVSDSLEFVWTNQIGTPFPQYIELKLNVGASAVSELEIISGAAFQFFKGTNTLGVSSGQHFVVLTFSQTSNTFDLSVDNVSVWSGSINSGSGFTTPTTEQFQFPDTGSRAISHVVTFAAEAASVDIDGLWQLGSAPYTGELSSVRLTRMLDDAGWPTVWRDIDTGVQAVGAYRPNDLSAREYAEQVDGAEQGALFIDREGQVQLVNRTTAEAVNVTALFDDAGTDLPFTGVQVDANTVDAIRNSVAVRYATDTVTVEDATSVTAYGRAQQSLDARLIDDPDDAEAIGDVVLARGKDPRTRIRQLQVTLRADTANLLPVLSQMELADDVTVSFTPTSVGDELWRAVRVQGVSHSITPERWDCQLYLAPGPVGTNGPLVVLDDDTYGKLSDGNKLG